MAVFNRFLTSLDLDPEVCGSTLTMASTEAIPTSKPKHRSCDECRTRKLACSKDPAGCERCKKENISCHYSEQKPMGRPRKRQFIAVEEPIEGGADEPLDVGQLPFLPDNFNPYTQHNVSEPYYINQSTINPTHIVPHGAKTIWHFGDGQLTSGNINFDELDIAPDGGMASLSEPHSSSNSMTSASLTHSNGSSPQSLPTPGPAVPCSCLASMYLALSSLQSFPTDIVAALKTVRGAAATAAACIWCPSCGAVVLENPNPPIESFQNTMLLGTILPIIANSYQKLLKMIDDETEYAIALGNSKTFRFHDYGGMCGKQTDLESSMICMEKEIFFNSVEMPPHQWRSTVRALLRVDIYGHEQSGFKHKGLKDLVNEMEGRQRARHELLDAHAAAGSMKLGAFGSKLCLGEQSHGCLQVLNMAKIAIDNLAIP